MRVDDVVSIGEMRRLAVRRLPKILGDWLEGGAEDELAVRRNIEQFRSNCLVPRYLVDISQADATTKLFDRTFACPFGIAPTGYPALFWPEGDLMLARAAADANVPFIMSGASTATIESIAAVAPNHCWFQLYPARDEGITRDLVDRARDAGLAALVVTVDVPAPPKRDRDLRNKFRMPLQLRPSLILDGVLHPSWTIRYLSAGGLPIMANWARYAPKGANASGVALFAGTQYYPTLTWRELENIRERWPRKLILKGIMDPEDARSAAAMGIDGIIVSNHGGRQSDRLPTPVEMLPRVVEAVPDVAVMMDGGIRRGADVVTALCLGARFVFVGRGVLYGLAVSGRRGVQRSLTILKDEMLTTMRQIGRTTVEELALTAVIATHTGCSDTP
jgi:L-lactate dehydrogenase (cytochrome)/(S)-mandelate dehydrogenase